MFGLRETSASSPTPSIMKWRRQYFQLEPRVKVDDEATIF